MNADQNLEMFWISLAIVRNARSINFVGVVFKRWSPQLVHATMKTMHNMCARWAEGTWWEAPIQATWERKTKPLAANQRHRHATQKCTAPPTTWHSYRIIYPFLLHHSWLLSGPINYGGIAGLPNHCMQQENRMFTGKPIKFISGLVYGYTFFFLIIWNETKCS